MNEEQHRFIEKVLDNQQSLVNEKLSILICDGQFLIPKEGDIRDKFNELMVEMFRSDTIIKECRKLFEEGY